MSNLIDIFISFSLSQLLLCTVLLLRRPTGHALSEKLFIALLLADAAYLIIPWVSADWARAILYPAQTMVPGLFWLFSYSLFDDHFRLRPWQLIPFIITVVLPTAATFADLGESQIGQLLWFQLPQFIEFVLLGWALKVILAHWQDDLLEQRRNLRIWFSAFIGFYIFALIAAQQLLFPSVEWLAIWQYAPAGVMLFLCNCVLLEFKQDVFYQQAPPLPQANIETEAETKATKIERQHEQEEVPDGVLEAISLLMEGEKIYREMGLTIGQLADKIEIQEYRLRRIINAGLGYRNFNDFLNRYRVQEACERLASKTEQDTAVLNIALDAGFRSLSSFNKAFKDSQGMTPTAYRKSQLN
ncbi:helix-turn-helix domain-containing protein [uncultured Pseudoteredinibacter sp.]|uniref:helix-turn-helix domain-containing protein n=1 Tax=uncultured Pseudoteredinibacter sp. TaxID=1641701 RepID=UPI0026114B3D|nr:helix-turn-helix domain-containing protein [uncultured Pseudoteredinibacter sp.]